MLSQNYNINKLKALKYNNCFNIDFSFEKLSTNSKDYLQLSQFNCFAKTHIKGVRYKELKSHFCHIFYI